MEYGLKSNFAKLAVALLLGLSASFALAQGIVTGSISGIATDASGALISDASVTAKHIATNRDFTTQSTNGGVISLRSLPPGTYDVRIEAKGFRSHETTAVTVSVGTDTSLGVVILEVGASSETVTVESSAPLIEATTDQMSQSFTTESTANLPIGNNFDSLTLFVPGVAAAGDMNFTNTNGSGFVANGQRSRSNNFQIDGQNNNDNSIAGPSIFFGNQDAIAEVQVVTNYSAEYGRNTGSVVNYVTKSGTNQFHGTGYEFWAGNTFSSLTNEEKNPALGNCLPSQDPATDGCTKAEAAQYVDNRFGGTIGGPIVKDHAWFFGSTNFERTRAGGSPSSSAPGIVPTANGVQQLIAAFPTSPAGPLLAAVGPAGITSKGNPSFSNLQNIGVSNVVGANCDPTAPQPVDPSCVPIEFGTVTRFVASPFNDYEGTGRVDVRLTSKDNFFGRYVFQQQLNDGVNFGNGVDVGDWQLLPGRDQQIGLDWVRNFSNSFINQVRFSYSRARFFFEEGSVPSCNDQNPLACPPDFIMNGVAPQDRVTFGVASGFPQGRVINVYQLQDNASKLIGKHTLKIGGEYDKQRSPNVFLPNNNGLYIFSSFNDLVADNPLQTRVTVGNPKLPFQEKDVALYFQDDWRVTENLTLNLGLRWEWNQQAINLLHDRTVADAASSNPLWPATDPATGLAIPLGLRTVPRIPEDYNNVGPVFGFAWTPHFGMLSAGKTVVRGGFRLSYDPEFYNIFLNVATAAPTVNAVTLASPGPGTLPTSGFTGADVLATLQPLLPPTNPGKRNQTTVAPNFHNPYSEQWNFGVQQEITPKMVMEVRYVGNHGVGLFQSFNGNPALTTLVDGGFQSQIPAGLTPCTTAGAPGSNAGYANCNLRRVVERANTAWSKYNSLQSELRIGNWHGLTSTASYTWSHTLDNASEIFSTAAGGNTLSFPQNPFNIDRAERANSGIDFPNVFGLTVMYDLPFAKDQHGFLGHLIGGWQVNTTYRYTTGQPYTTIQDHASTLCDPTSTLSSTFDACRPIVSNPNAPLSSVGACTDPTLPNCGIVNFVTGAPTTFKDVHWIQNEDTAAAFFGSPFLGTPRNTLRGQAISTANLAVFKNFKFGERLTFQLQAQAFNVLNHMFRGAPDPVLDDVALQAPGAPPAFQSTAYNFSGGGNNLEGGGSSSANATFDGIGRRRLLFGLKVIF